MASFVAEVEAKVQQVVAAVKADASKAEVEIKDVVKHGEVVFAQDLQADIATYKAELEKVISSEGPQVEAALRQLLSDLEGIVTQVIEEHLG